MFPSSYSNSNAGLSRVGECSFLGWSLCLGEHGQFALVLGGQLNSAKDGLGQRFFHLDRRSKSKKDHPLKLRTHHSNRYDYISIKMYLDADIFIKIKAEKRLSRKVRG